MVSVCFMCSRVRIFFLTQVQVKSSRGNFTEPVQKALAIRQKIEILKIPKGQQKRVSEYKQGEFFFGHNIAKTSSYAVKILKDVQVSLSV